MEVTDMRTRRKAIGWSQKYVGQQVGISNVAVHNLEIGKKKPSHEVMLKICELFQVPHEEVKQLFPVAADENNLSAK